MKLLICIILLAYLSYISGQQCDNLGVVLYEDLACQPVSTTNSSCPSSFVCKNLTASGKCVYRDKIYSDSERIPDNPNGYTCRFGCFCGFTANGPSVACALSSCLQTTSRPGCYRRYDLKQCCSTEEICPPYNDTTECIVDGIKISAGERFLSKNSCHDCLCQKGWSGRYEEPYCIRRICNVQKKNQAEVQKYCAPVYLNSGPKCCPDVWICPDGSEVIHNGNEQSNLTCKYGDRIMGFGDYFEKDVVHFWTTKRVKCECQLPPLLTCTV